MRSRKVNRKSLLTKSRPSKSCRSKKKKNYCLNLSQVFQSTSIALMKLSFWISMDFKSQIMCESHQSLTITCTLLLRSSYLHFFPHNRAKSLLEKKIFLAPYYFNPTIRRIDKRKSLVLNLGIGSKHNWYVEKKLLIRIKVIIYLILSKLEERCSMI